MTDQEKQVQLKTARVSEQQHSIDRWNRWYLFFLGVTVIAGAGTVVTTQAVLRKTNSLSKDESDISNLKDSIAEQHRQAFLSDLTSKGVEIALAQKSAAEANSKAEAEKLEREKLEAQVAPRRLSLSQQATIAKSCLGLYGKPLIVQSYTQDVEAAILARQIASALSAFNVRPRIGQVVATSQDFGIQIEGPADEDVFMACLANVLRDQGGLAVSVNGTMHTINQYNNPEGGTVMNYPPGSFPLITPDGPRPAGSFVSILVGSKPALYLHSQDQE